jgi:hypothetical protein
MDTSQIGQQSTPAPEPTPEDDEPENDVITREDIEAAFPPQPEPAPAR